MSEKDPTGKNPHEPGAKLDAGKSPVFQGLIDYFPRACIAVAGISGFGASKYAWKGWQSVPDGVNRYSNALGRHMMLESIEGPFDKDSGLLHKAHAAWNALAALELYLREEYKTSGKVVEGNAGSNQGAGLVPKCLPKSSEENEAFLCGRDVLPTESSGRSGGAAGGYCKGTPETGTGSTRSR